MCPIHRNGRHGNQRLLRESSFQRCKCGVAFGQPEVEAIGMDHDVDEVGIIEGSRRALEGRLIE